MNAVSDCRGFFDDYSYVERRLFRLTRVPPRAGLWIVIAAGHVALIYALGHLSPVAQAPSAVPIQALILPETVIPHEAPPPPQPKIVDLQMPSIEPPLVNLPADQAPTNAITVAVSPEPRVVTAPPREVTDVAYVQPPQPRYPAESRRRGEEGMVLLRVIIDELGRANRIEIARSSGHVRLDDAARAAVQRALFQPYVENGVARAVLATIPIEFIWKAHGGGRGGSRHHGRS